MVVEIKGQQLRIRLANPKRFSKFRTLDVGKKGRLQIVMGHCKSGWKKQSYRLNLDDYKNKQEVIKEVKKLDITAKKKQEATRLINKYFD